jgi:hypothetical protein
MMYTSILDHYKAIFVEQEWLSEKAFLSQWESWEQHSKGRGQDVFDFLQGSMRKIGEAISQDYRGSDAMYPRLRPVFFHLWQLHKRYKKDGSEYYKQVAFCDFQEAALRPYRQSVIFITTGCCSACEERDGQVISLSAALTQQPIPQEKCTRSSGCLCSYGIFGDRDPDGNLIMK